MSVLFIETSLAGSWKGRARIKEQNGVPWDKEELEFLEGSLIFLNEKLNTQNLELHLNLILAVC